jgi:hypothetical protein
MSLNQSRGSSRGVAPWVLVSLGTTASRTHALSHTCQPHACQPHVCADWWEFVEILGRKLPLVMIVIFIDDPADKCFYGSIALCALMAATTHPTGPHPSPTPWDPTPHPPHGTPPIGAP